MATYTANQVSIITGSRAVRINSNEEPLNVRKGDFIQIANHPLKEIKGTYKDENSNNFIELETIWENISQNNQPAIVIPTTADFRATAEALKKANIIVNDNMQQMQDWQTKFGEVTFNNIDGTMVTVKTLKQMESDFEDLMYRLENSEPTCPAEPQSIYIPNGQSNKISGHSVTIPDGDFELTFNFLYKKSPVSQTILGDIESEESYLSVNSDTSVRVRSAGALSLLTLNNPLIEGQHYKANIYRRGLTIGVSFDDYAFASRAIGSAPAITFNTILARQYGSFSSSAIWELVLKSGETELLNIPLTDISETIKDTVNGSWVIEDHNLDNWTLAPIFETVVLRTGINGIRDRMETAAQGINGYNYIVSGDSTRFNGYNRMLEMYQTQLDKINMPRVNNSQSGQSATRWLANEGGATLAAALAATPGDGSKTIMEFSFGLNDFSLGLSESQIKQTISDCIDAYLLEKSKAIVFLVSPVPTAQLDRNEIMIRIYNELASEKDLFLVDGNISMMDVLGKDAYYQDQTHPNSNGSLRLLNWILSKISPPSLYSVITMDRQWLWPELLPSPHLEKAVTNDLYDTTTGMPVVNVQGRKMEWVDVEPNFEINIRHQGNLNTVIFFDYNGIKVESMTYDPASDAPIIVPPPAVYAKINISDQGSDYDSLNDTPTVRYVYERVANLTMTEINQGNYINLLDVT